jgi:soluble lytic murein transglycosylase-like protein
MTNMKLKLFAALAATVLAVSFSAPSFAKSPYDKIIAKYARTYGVPVSLAHAVIRVESNYKPKARGSAGEIGLMQLKLQTARGLGYRGSARGLYNPATNLRYGMAYLGQARKLGGRSVCGTILKYNAGHYAKRMNPISARYCSKVKAHLRG